MEGPRSKPPMMASRRGYRRRMNWYFLERPCCLATTVTTCSLRLTETWRLAASAMRATQSSRMALYSARTSSVTLSVSQP
uniref:Uncharacterized protein n=1 Tax=Arcella intermedia TaxID=1963864 RepID=A0A6B2LVZ1_9EUKA